MFVETDVKIVPLTHEYVRGFWALPTFGGDRDRLGTGGKRRIKWLRSKLENKQFFSPVWGTAVLQATGVKYRVNGGHSSAMLMELNGEFPSNARAIVREFECQTDEDFAILFDQFDPKRSSRTKIEKVRAHLYVEGSLTGVSPTMCNDIIGGIAYGLTCNSSWKPDEDERIGLMHEYQNFIMWAKGFAGRRMLQRSSVLGAMFSIRAKGGEALSHAFWTQVRDEDHPDSLNATRVLANFLKANVVAGKERRCGNEWSPRAFYVKCIHGWNAWRTNAGTQLKYRPDTDIPKIYS